MWPAHVSFPIDCNLADTQGDGSSSHTAAFPAESNGKQSYGARLQFSHHSCDCSSSETGNVVFQKCLKTMANRELKEKVM